MEVVAHKCRDRPQNPQSHQIKQTAQTESKTRNAHWPIPKKFKIETSKSQEYLNNKK